LENLENLENLMVRTRHRAKLIPIKLLNLTKISAKSYGTSKFTRQSFSETSGRSSNSEWVVELDEEVRALTPGQSAVIYSGEQVLGGGIVV